MIQEYFLRVFKFPKIKDRGPNFSGEQIRQNDKIIWSSLLYLNFKRFKDPKFIHSAWFWSTFLRVSKFSKIKDGGPNFLGGGETILQNGWIIWSPL